MSQRNESTPSARGTVDVVGHRVLTVDEALELGADQIQNVILPQRPEPDGWYERVTAGIGDWRAVFRSTYIQWALTINGLHTAAAVLRERGTRFAVSSLRHRDGGVEQTPIAVYEAEDAARHHLAAQRKVVASAIIDLYAALETFVFSLAREYYTSRPGPLLQGDDFRELRELRAAAEAAKCGEPVEAWRAAWNERLDRWQRKKLYDGLGPTFSGLCRSAKLTAPSGWATGPDEWGKTITLFSVLRNAVIHGAETVSDDLAAASRIEGNAGLSFEAGAPLEVDLLTLQAFELFCSQLLTALNLALVEQYRELL